MIHPKTAMIRTFSGREVNPLFLKEEDIVIEDIAHALALVNRFNGHTARPISVAQHSVWASILVDFKNPTLQLRALLHDAAEAYLGDVTKWLKATPEMEAYRVAERRAQDVIERRFGLPRPTRGELTSIEWADRLLVRYEGLMGFGESFVIDHPNYPPLDQSDKNLLTKWNWMAWYQVEVMFLNRYSELKEVLCGA